MRITRWLTCLQAVEANKPGTLAKRQEAIKAACDADPELCRKVMDKAIDLAEDFTPVLGDYKSFKEAETAVDYLTATVGVLPGGRVAGKLLKAAQAALKKGDIAEASKLINKVGNEVSSAKYFGQERKYWSAEPVNINGNKVYQRNDLFDPKYVDPKSGKTNLELMQVGRAPVGKDGKPVNLHHMLQKQDGPIAEVTQSFHKDNHSVIHINDNSIPSGINRNEFNKWRSDYWKQRANDFK